MTMAERRNGLPQEVRKTLEANPGFADLSHLACIECETTYPSSEVIYKCTSTTFEKQNGNDSRGICGDILDVRYEFRETDPEFLKELWLARRMSNAPQDRSGVWRFRETIPFIDDPNSVVTLFEGNTPLFDAPVSAKYIGLPRLRLKHQGFNPTGSFKDPGMTAAVSIANSLSMEAVACASTGNTSASMAAYAKRAGFLPIVFIPEGQIAIGKLSQALDYGALTMQIKGDFDEAMGMVMRIAPKLGIYVVNSINPYRIEGQKTMVYELMEQLSWEVPDRIVVPGGNLGHASSIGKALHEMVELGFIDKMPRITVIQAEGADPLYETITSDDPNQLITVHAKTLATAVKIGNPISWKKAKNYVNETDGWVEKVSEQEIADAKAIVGREGIGCEPASALTVAGIKKLVEFGTDSPIDKDEDVVVILTGNVLKDPDYTVNYHMDRLYEDYVTSLNVLEKAGKIGSTFANAPIQVEADEAAIARIIEERLANARK